LIEQFTRFLRLKPQPKLWHWTPVLLHRLKDHHHSFALFGTHKNESAYQLIGFGENPIHEEISIISPDSTPLNFIVGEVLPQQGWCKLGLDNCSRWKSSISATL
jgi:hypothetical protein